MLSKKARRSFNICKALSCAFFKSVVASAVFFGAVCREEGARVADRNRLNNLIKKASNIIGITQEGAD